MSEITTKQKSSQELITLDDTILNTVLEQLSEGKTLASIKREGTLPCSLKKFYDFLNQENNKELKETRAGVHKFVISKHVLDMAVCQNSFAQMGTPGVTIIYCK